MTNQIDTDQAEQHSTGEVCPGCDCELVVSSQGSGVLLECDCGSVFALCSNDDRLITAA